MKKNSNNKNALIVTIGILTLIIIVISFMFWKDMKILNNAYSDMNQIEFLSSSTQRLINIASSENFLQKDVFFIGDSTLKALTPDLETSISVLNDPDMVKLANEVITSWNTIDLILKDDLNSVDLGLARDSHFKAMTNLTGAISDYSKELNDRIAMYQGGILVFIFALGLVMLNNILNTHTELMRSRVAAAVAKIDTATGLFNRSTCQEILNVSKAIPSNINMGIVVLDLNDLKKTNDTLGHRAGDELIQSFANLLKAATEQNPTKPFIGRYGGDEFIIHYTNLVSEDVVISYLDELSRLTMQFNEDETRFKVSYAQGYACVIENDDSELTIQHLFDKADEFMYENKIAGKNAKNNDA